MVEARKVSMARQSIPFSRRASGQMFISRLRKYVNGRVF
jgi:hypothetical protein